MKSRFITPALFFTITWLFEIAKGNFDKYMWIRLGVAVVLWLIYAVLPKKRASDGGESARELPYPLNKLPRKNVSGVTRRR